jgi:hypothetical protein
LIRCSLVFIAATEYTKLTNKLFLLASQSEMCPRCGYAHPGLIGQTHSRRSAQCSECGTTLHVGIIDTSSVSADRLSFASSFLTCIILSFLVLAASLYIQTLKYSIANGSISAYNDRVSEQNRSTSVISKLIADCSDGELSDRHDLISPNIVIKDYTKEFMNGAALFKVARHNIVYVFIYLLLFATAILLVFAFPKRGLDRSVFCVLIILLVIINAYMLISSIV